MGPGATDMVTGAAPATINRLPMLLSPDDTFATRAASSVLRGLELPYAADISVDDTFRPVSRFFDRAQRPEQLAHAATQAMRVLTDARRPARAPSQPSRLGEDGRLLPGLG